MLIRRPAWARSPGLLLGAYALQICETPAELLAVQRWLSKPCPLRKLPDGRTALDLRGPLGPASASGAVWTAAYAPPADGWPWLVIVRLPAPEPSLGGLYASDAFATEAAWLAHIRKLHGRWPDRPVRTPDDVPQQ